MRSPPFYGTVSQPVESTAKGVRQTELRKRSIAPTEFRPRKPGANAQTLGTERKREVKVYRIEAAHLLQI